MSKLIIWKCETCNQSVKNGQGYISASTTDAYQAERDEQSRNQRPLREHLLTRSQLRNIPELVHWRVACTGCDPWASDFDYAIDVERIRTVKQALSWTAHLMEKSWVAQTDWSNIVRRSVLDERL